MAKYFRELSRQLIVAAIAFGLAVAFRESVSALTGVQLQYLTFFPAVIAATLFGGLWGGLFETMLGACMATRWARPTVAGHSIADDLVILAVFLLTCLFLVIMGWLVNRARRATEEALAEVRLATAQSFKANQVVRETLDSITDAFVALDRHWQITYVNPAAQKILGKTSFQLLGQSTQVLYPNADPQVRTHLERAMRDATPVEFEFADPDRHRHFNVKAYPRSEEGISIHFRDITEQKLTAKAVQESERRFARFMQHLPGLAWSKDLEGRYVFANEAAQKLFGKSADQLYGKTDFDIFPPETANQFRENDQKALASELGYQTIESVDHGGGDIHYSVVSKFPIPDSEGNPALVGGMAIDVTERMKMEESLVEADRRKDEFLATLAHELRNPLAPVSNALHILRLSGDLPPAAERVREIMERQVNHLVRLVEDLLEVSRVTRGKIDLRKEPVELASIIESAVDTSRPLIEAAGHQLAISISPEVVILHVDPVRMVQVISNLLNNAAKYTDRAGQIWLTAHRNGDEVVISVRDTGMGIPPEMLPRVFDMFAQIDRTLKRSQGGLGIGLTLAKNLVQMHGGKIEVRSAGQGQGSEFLIRLPAQPATLTSSPPAKPLSIKPPLPPRKIIVVDDTQAAVFILGRLLEALGQQVRTADSGAQALEFAQQEKPDVLISDIAMPNMDGYELATRLRRTPGMHGVVLVALTGYSQDSDRKRALEAGFDYHLVKPVSLEALQNLLGALPTNSAAGIPS